MTPALLALALTISSGSATASSQETAGTVGGPVPASSTAATTFPPVVAAVSLGCADSRLEINLTANTRLEFGGDIGHQPPMILATGHALVTLPGQPGQSVTWVVRNFDTGQVYGAGVHVVPPCLSAPEVPQIGTGVRVERRRVTFWRWSERRFATVLGGVR